MEEKPGFLSGCPICGRILFRGTPESHIEGSCPKCLEYLSITYMKRGVYVVIKEKEEK